MICLVIQIENYICEVYFVGHLVCTWVEVPSNCQVPVKELSLIIMDVVVWDTTVIYVLKRGCLGTCLWECLAVRVRGPKWSLPG